MQKRYQDAALEEVTDRIRVACNIWYPKKSRRPRRSGGVGHLWIRGRSGDHDRLHVSRPIEPANPVHSSGQAGSGARDQGTLRNTGPGRDLVARSIASPKMRCAAMWKWGTLMVNSPDGVVAAHHVLRSSETHFRVRYDKVDK